MNTNNDIKWMTLALALAQKGGYHIRPNPLVGAVIVKNNQLISTGYHQCCGKEHAEIIALKNAGKRAKGGTLYITLEPCNHYGRTPPCTEALKKSGLREVFAAMKDPNPIVSGRGLSKLTSFKIKVNCGLLKDKAKELNRVYIKNITKHEPYVILKMAQTLDGKIASVTSDSRWISCKESRNMVHTWRTESEGVMVGINTVKKDNPSLTSHGKGRNPLRIIIGNKNTLSTDLKIFNNNKITFYNKGKINLKQVIKNLYKKGIYQLLIEGGGILSANAFADDIVDEIRFFIAPKILGGKEAITSVEGLGIKEVNKAIKIKNWFWESVGSDMLVKGYIH